MKDTETKFPQYIDDRIFYQDINIEQVPVMNHYHSILSKGDYSKASEFLNNSEAFFYGAWLLNLFEKRLCAIADYLVKLPPKEPLVDYQSEQPLTATEGTHWISSDDDISDTGTWEHVSINTWEQLSKHTWEQIQEI